jgi:uncharacterized membrane protein YcaP (DUF421 family)
MRVMGKRQLGELEPAEFVVAILISDLAVNPLQDLGTPLLYGLVPVMTLLFCEVMMSWGMMKSMRLRKVIAGVPSIIIENGKLRPREMRRNRYTLDELAEHLRKSNVNDIASVKRAVLETDGTLSALLYSNESAVTPKQLALTIDEPDVPLAVISDGIVVDANLKTLGFEPRWLEKTLRDKGISAPDGVFLMTADRGARVYIAMKDAKG